MEVFRSHPLQVAHGRVHDVQRRLGSEAIRQLVAEYEAGRPTTWLMRTYGLGKGTVLSILEQHGVKMRGQGVPPDRLQEAIQLYRSGLSLKQVAARLDCSAEMVRQALLATGVQVRARWQRGLDEQPRA